MLPLLLLALAQAPAAPLSLEIRVFLGAEEVTAETRATVHRAGERGDAVAQSQPSSGTHVFAIAEGIYDAQVVRERDGRVLNIRWAERLVVMPYPDEGGKHLEIINFSSGYGALQVRTTRPGGLPPLALFAAGARSRPVAAPVSSRAGTDYALFIVPSGRYDLRIEDGPRHTWHTDLDVPLDRTRLRVVP
jgi:hypothetical protein